MIIRKYSFEDIDLTEEEVYEQRLFRVVVLGLARSGTSMTSGIMEKLGVNFLYNTEDADELKEREEKAVKRFGKLYKMNEKFYEISNSRGKLLLDFQTIPYTGLKLILPLRDTAKNLLKSCPVRVVQIWRDVEEIRQSQQAAYSGKKVFTEEEAEKKRTFFRESLIQGGEFLNDNNIQVQHYQYRDILNSPEEKISKIAKFINAPNSIEEAVKWVDPSCNRFKAECLKKNI